MAASPPQDPTPPRRPEDPGDPSAAPLDAAARARGRRIAITSHPAGMTFSLVFTQHLPTLALVALGASEAAIGIQNGLGHALQPLQLPVLRAIGRISKRKLLIAGQTVAVLGGLPLVFFDAMVRGAGELGVAVCLASMGVVMLGRVVADTVWFPLLRGYVEIEETGRFFGVLRSGWHLALIVYYLSALAWLAGHPGDFGPLFAVGWAMGVLRIALVWRLPERSERTGAPIRVRDAVRLVRTHATLGRFLVAITAASAVRLCVLPFAIVMMRRELGFSDDQVLLTTIAHFAGGLASLYLWGRIVDRVGPMPVFRWTSVAAALLMLALVAAREPGAESLALLVAITFGLSVVGSGFGVADTRFLFDLTPADSPSSTLVASQVIVTVAAGVVPPLVGWALDSGLSQTDDRLGVYGCFFAIAAACRLLAYLPLRGLPAAAPNPRAA